ncbi:MAG: DUF4397 domain-containing protein [Bacteroidota bacterium]
MKSFLTAFFLLALLPVTFAQLARIQFIHNAPGGNVDIYVDGNLYVNNLVFRTATPYVDVPAGTLELQIAPGSSASAADAMEVKTIDLEGGETYVALLGSNDKDNMSYELHLTDQVSEYADTGNTIGVAFANGTPDAGALDFYWKEFGFALFDDIAYGEFGAMVSLPTGSYEIDITSAYDNEEIFITNTFDFSWWRGRSMTFFTSGFADDEDDPMKTYVALSTGGTFLLESLSTGNEENKAFVQFIHNAARENVDIYVDDKKVQDDLVYRTASTFLELTAKREVTIGVAPKNSRSVEDVYKKHIVTIRSESNYIVMLNGSVSDTPDELSVIVYDQAQQDTNDDSTVALLFANAATNAPDINLSIPDELDYMGLSEGKYTNYYELAPDKYALQVSYADGTTLTYDAAFRFWKGGTAVVYTSGNYEGDAAELKLYVALPTGGTFPLRLLDTSELEGRHSTVTTDQTVRIRTLGNVTHGYFETALELPEEVVVRATIFSGNGLPIRALKFGSLAAGRNSIDIDAYDLTSGHYFVRWEVGRVVQTQHIIVAKH